jgi:hypothetical protein
VTIHGSQHQIKDSDCVRTISWQSGPVLRARSGHADDAYYLSDKANQCVVCGHTGDYLRHSIVPHCYRYKKHVYVC